MAKRPTTAKTDDTGPTIANCTVTLNTAANEHTVAAVAAVARAVEAQAKANEAMARTLEKLAEIGGHPYEATGIKMGMV